MRDIKDTVLEAIEEMLEGEYDSEYGICTNLFLKTPPYFQARSEVLYLSPNWEHYSGEENFPVSGEVIYNKHDEEGTLWEGEQLELRMSLLKHLKKRIENMSSTHFNNIIGY